MWSSSKASVAAVKNGRITARRRGTSAITAEISCILSVVFGRSCRENSSRRCVRYFMGLIPYTSRNCREKWESETRSSSHISERERSEVKFLSSHSWPRTAQFFTGIVCPSTSRSRLHKN